MHLGPCDVMKAQTQSRTTSGNCPTNAWFCCQRHLGHAAHPDAHRARVAKSWAMMGTALFRLGNYQLGERLGPEGAVETYRARTTDGDSTAFLNKRPFVVKVLRADRVAGDRFQALAARFMAAGQRLLGPQRPGMVRVLEVNQSAKGAYVVSDFVVGMDFAGLLKAAQAQSSIGRSVDPAVVAVVGAKLARVLTAAHTAPEPLHHLGLCPGNVLITETGDVVVLDFGLFASVRGLVDHAIDKWSFVAPELLGADPAENRPIDGVAADLFALGGLLFYLLSGRPPVEARSLADLYDLAWEPLPELPRVPDQLNSAIRALTTPDPQARSQTAEQALQWLTAVGDAPPDMRQTGLNPAFGSTETPAATAINSATAQVSTPAEGALPARTSAAGAAAVHQARPRPSPRRWLKFLLAATAALVGITAASLFAMRAARHHFQEKHARQVAAALAKSVEIPAVLRPPEFPPPMPGKENAHAVVPVPKRKLPRVPGHLSMDTNPTGADLWIDGVLHGKTPLDVEIGPGGHRVMAIAAGHRIFRAVFDTTEGDIVKRDLSPVDPPVRGNAFVNVECRSPGKYPVQIDNQETGLLCPTKMIPVPAGLHQVALFVPSQRGTVAQELDIPAGPKPTVVHFKE